MAEGDLSFLVGELKGEFRAIKEHLTQQDQRTEINKRLAIEARQRLEGKVDAIGEQSASSADWIKTHGQPMAEEWFRSQERRKLAKAEFRGKAMTWGKIVGVASLLLTIIGFLGRESIASIAKKIGEALS